MSNNRYANAALAAALATATLIIVNYAAYRARLVPFVPLDAVDLIIRLTPGAIATAAIDTLRQLAKRMLEISGILGFLAAGTLAGWRYARSISRPTRRQSWWHGLLLGAVAFVIIEGIELTRQWSGLDPARSSLVLLVLALAWGIAVSFGVAAVLPVSAVEVRRPPAVSRRALLIGAAGVVAAVGLVELVRIQSSKTTVSAAPLPELPTPLSTGFIPAPGTWPELTSNKDFYRIDVDALPPGLSTDRWQLDLSSFSQSTTLTLQQLTSKFEPVHFFATLECISNYVGGNLMSTTEWTGARLKDVLQMAGVPDGTKDIVFECADGFTSSLTLDQATDEQTILAYLMNGQPLPYEHGYPVRLYTPNLYGEKNPKWIVRVSPSPRAYLGYWQVRGWTDVATVQQTTIIKIRETTAVAGMAAVGGVAFAGARGIAQVEVSINGGGWQQATLKSPPLSGLTWVPWRFAFPAKAGDILTLTARCTDGTGSLQTAQNIGAHLQMGPPAWRERLSPSGDVQNA